MYIGALEIHKMNDYISLLSETLPVLSIEENRPCYEDIWLLFSAFRNMRGITTVSTVKHMLMVQRTDYVGREGTMTKL
jgi:hypothetical protein